MSEPFADQDYAGASSLGGYEKESAMIGSQTTRLIHRPRLQRLKDAKRGLEVKLAEVNKAIELLEANPQMYELMEAVERAGF